MAFSIEELKKELETREHIPNKVERKKQDKIKQEVRNSIMIKLTKEEKAQLKEYLMKRLRTYPMHYQSKKSDSLNILMVKYFNFAKGLRNYYIPEMDKNDKLSKYLVEQFKGK